MSVNSAVNDRRCGGDVGLPLAPLRASIITGAKWSV
jgi:hypothetical protein